MHVRHSYLSLRCVPGSIGTRALSAPAIGGGTGTRRAAEPIVIAARQARGSGDFRDRGQARSSSLRTAQLALAQRFADQKQRGAVTERSPGGKR